GPYTRIEASGEGGTCRLRLEGGGADPRQDRGRDRRTARGDGQRRPGRDPGRVRRRAVRARQLRAPSGNRFGSGPERYEREVPHALPSCGACAGKVRENVAGGNAGGNGSALAAGK